MPLLYPYASTVIFGYGSFVVVLKPKSVGPLNLSFFLTLFGSLELQIRMNLKFSFSISTENNVGILIGISLKLLIALSRLTSGQH